MGHFHIILVQREDRLGVCELTSVRSGSKVSIPQTYSLLHLGAVGSTALVLTLRALVLVCNKEAA